MRELSLLGQIHGEWDQHHTVHSRYHSSCIHAVMTFKDKLTRSEIREIVERGFGGMDAFNALLKRNSRGRFCWDTSALPEGYDLGDNIEFRDQKQIERDIDEVVAEELFLIDLPTDRLPPWRLYVFETRMGESVLVFKFHHCIADGAGLSAIFARMADGDQGNIEMEQLGQAMRQRFEAEMEKQRRLTLFEKIAAIIVQLFTMIIVLGKLIYFTFKPKLSKDWIYERDDLAFPLRKFVRAPGVKIETVRERGVCVC
jgi:hypothetical protein